MRRMGHSNATGRLAGRQASAGRARGVASVVIALWLSVAGAPLSSWSAALPPVLEKRNAQEQAPVAEKPAEVPSADGVSDPSPSAGGNSDGTGAGAEGEPSRGAEDDEEHAVVPDVGAALGQWLRRTGKSVSRTAETIDARRAPESDTLLQTHVPSPRNPIAAEPRRRVARVPMATSASRVASSDEKAAVGGAETPEIASEGPHFFPATPWSDQFTAGRFRFFADQPIDLATRRDAVEIVFLEADLAQTLNLTPSVETVEIYLFGDAERMKAFLRDWLPGVPFRRALYLRRDGPGCILTFRSDKLAADLRHEGTHALLHASLDEVPLWLDEGLAEYFEEPADTRVHDHPHLGMVRMAALFRSLADLDSLETLNGMESMSDSDYRACWSWVHFLLHESQDTRAALRAYLVALGWNRGPADAEDVRPSDSHGAPAPGADTSQWSFAEATPDHSGEAAARSVGPTTGRRRAPALSTTLERQFPELASRIGRHFRNWK